MAIFRLTDYGAVYGDLPDSEQAQRLLNRTALANCTKAAMLAGGTVDGGGNLLSYEMVPGTANDRIAFTTAHSNTTARFAGIAFKQFPRSYDSNPVYTFYSNAATGLSLWMEDVTLDLPDQKSVTYWGGSNAIPVGPNIVYVDNGWWYHISGASPVASYPNHGTNNITLTRVTATGRMANVITQSRGHMTCHLTDVDIEYGLVGLGLFDSYGVGHPERAYNREVYYHGTVSFSGGYAPSETIDGTTGGVSNYLVTHTGVDMSDATSVYLEDTRCGIKQYSGSQATELAPPFTILRNLEVSMTQTGGICVESSGMDADHTDIADCTFRNGSLSLRNNFTISNVTLDNASITGTGEPVRADTVVGLIEDVSWTLSTAGASGLSVDSGWRLRVKNPAVVFSGLADSTTKWLVVDGSDSDIDARVEGGTLSADAAGKGIGVSSAANTARITVTGTTMTNLWSAARFDGGTYSSRVDLNECDVSTCQRAFHFNGSLSVIARTRGTRMGSATVFSGAGAAAQALANRQARYTTAIAAASSVTLDRDSGAFTITGTGTINTLTWASLREFGKAVISLYSQDGFTLGSAGNIAAAVAGVVTAKSRIDLTYNTTTSKWERIVQPSVNISELEMKAVIRGATARSTTRR